MKQDKEDIYTGILLGFFLYFVGAINFQKPLSYILIFAIGTIIILPIFNIVKRILNKNS